MIFFVSEIEGEYAYLRPENACSMCEDIFIAMALLPPQTDVGSRISYDAGEYTLLS